MIHNSSITSLAHTKNDSIQNKNNREMQYKEEIQHLRKQNTFLQKLIEDLMKLKNK